MQEGAGTPQTPANVIMERWLGSDRMSINAAQLRKVLAEYGGQLPAPAGMSVRDLSSAPADPESVP
jgi:hypothetical protein